MSIYVLILFCFINIHIIYRIMSIYVPIRYIVIMVFCFLSIIFIFHIKSSRSIGLFDFSHSSSFFIFSSFSHYMKISVSLLSQLLMSFSLLYIHIIYEYRLVIFSHLFISFSFLYIHIISIYPSRCFLKFIMSLFLSFIFILYMNID